MKAPTPVPLEVIPVLLVIVGFAEVLQTTPRAVTALPPSAKTFPPEVAEVAVISEGARVETASAFDSPPSMIVHP